jgi:uncharacterized membrane protein YccC
MLRRAVADLPSAIDEQAQPPTIVGRRSPWGWPGIVSQLRAASGRHSVIVPAAARIGIAVAAGVGLGRALGVGHAYWVGLTAAGILMGSNLAATRSRPFSRLVGTVIGVGVAFLVLSGHPPLWLVILVAILFQGLVELVIAGNYGLAVIAITVLALTLFYLVTSEPLEATITARLLDTGVGAALAVLLRALLWPRSTAKRLPLVQANATTTIRRLLAETWTDNPDPIQSAEQRRRLQRDLVALRAVHAEALADTWPSVLDADRRWPVTIAVDELAVLALSWPPDRQRPSADQRKDTSHYLDKLAATISADGPPPGTPPSLPGHPRTTAALAALAVAVGDLRSAA